MSASLRRRFRWEVRSGLIGRYCHDTRSSGLFHYLHSGDDRLMRQAILGFAASLTAEGLIESRYPSHVHQTIIGFALYWILQVHDHYLYFADADFVRPLLSTIDRVLDYYVGYIDDRGLLSGFPPQHWQYVDWAAEWQADPDHLDNGVPAAGRKSNTHTFHTLLYAYTLQHSAKLLEWVRPALATEYRQRADEAIKAVMTHCYDGAFFTDSTVDVSHPVRYSQHCQVMGVLCDAVSAEDGARIIRSAFSSDRAVPGRTGTGEGSTFVKCSFVMMFYAFRAFSHVGQGVYEELYHRSFDPWRTMLENNLTTCEEDDVRHRSDCHAWGAVCMYELPVEVAGLKVLEPGWKALLWEPRSGLAKGVKARFALGGSNVAEVRWSEGKASLRLKEAVRVWTRSPGGDKVDQGVCREVSILV